MNHYLLILAFIFSATAARCQTEGTEGVPFQNGVPHYDTAIFVKGSKNELFFKAKTALYTIAIDRVIIVEDKDLGLLSARVSTDFSQKDRSKYGNSTYYFFSIIMRVADGKTSIWFTSFKSGRGVDFWVQTDENKAMSALSIEEFDKENRSTMNFIIKLMQETL